MNHLWLIQWRSLCSHKHLVNYNHAEHTIQTIFSQLPQAPKCLQPRSITFSSHVTHGRPGSLTCTRAFSSVTRHQIQDRPRRRTTPQQRVATKSTHDQNEHQYRDPRLRRLTDSDLAAIFGDQCPRPSVALTLLATLQSQREEGTLDLDLPTGLQTQLQHLPDAAENALRWLRKRYPLDEDAAILARIEREDAKKKDIESQELVARAEKLGIYKPQSGYFGAKRGENNSVFGVSMLDKIRQQNEEKEAKRKEEIVRKEKEQLEKDIAQGKAGPVDLQTLDLNERAIRRRRMGTTLQRHDQKANDWARKYRERATSKLTLDSPEIMNKSKFQRLFPTFIFATTFSALLIYYSSHVTDPLPDSRLFPNTPIATATISTIIALNALMFLVWKFPPAWPFLNRYFLSVPATPYAITSLTNIFSHPTFSHLGFNMFGLWLLGLPLHESLSRLSSSTSQDENNNESSSTAGRPFFLTLYLTSGVLSSFASQTIYTLRSNLITTSTGASGAIFAVFAALALLDPERRRFEFWMLPKQEWRERWSLDGKQMFGLVMGFEAFAVLATAVGLVRWRTDFVAHAAGAGVGAVWAWGLREGWVGKGKTTTTGERREVEK